MKGWVHVDKAIQIEDNRKTKPAKKYVVFYSTSETTSEYLSANSMEEAFLHTVTLKQKGVTNIKVFQEIQIKLQMA